MDIIAFTKSAQISPRKVRLVADVIRKQTIDDALATLAVAKKRGSGALEKTLRSAIANALNRNISRDKLFIDRIDVTDGPAYKRAHMSTRGRMHPYKKRTSHIRVVLSDEVKDSRLRGQAKQKVVSVKGEKNGTKS